MMSASSADVINPLRSRICFPWDYFGRCYGALGVINRRALGRSLFNLAIPVQYTVWRRLHRQPCVKAKFWTKPLNRLQNDSMIRDPHGPAIVPLVNVTKI